MGILGGSRLSTASYDSSLRVHKGFMNKEYAVIFKTKRNLLMPEEYTDLSKQLLALAKTLPGFKRIESVADFEGNGVSVSYWDSLESIRLWKENSTHLLAQEKGKSIWYSDYSVEICEVIRSYSKSERTDDF